MRKLMERLYKDESGQGMAEYAIILVVIALIAIAGFGILGGKINDKVGKAGDALN